MSLRLARRDWTEAGTVLAAAGRFFIRHYPVILTLGAVASLQRFLAVGGDERFAFAGGVGGELVTAAARVLLVVWVARRMFAGTEIAWAQVGPLLRRFVETRAGVLVASTALLVGLTVVAKVIPDAIGATLPEASRATYTSWELAIKNVTVIPFTIVWLTGLTRHALLAAEPAPVR